jgi:hypothetical protein
MTTEEFNVLLNSLINGLPASLVINRLAMALRGAIESGGADAEESFRKFVDVANQVDEDDDER